MKHSGKGEGPVPPQLHCGCSWLTRISFSHGWVAATTASQLGEGHGICHPEPLWVHPLSLPEPNTLASPMPYYPKSAVLRDRRVLEHYGRGYLESLWLGPQLRKLSPHLWTHQPRGGEVKAWHLHIFCFLENPPPKSPIWWKWMGGYVPPIQSPSWFLVPALRAFFCVTRTWSRLLRWHRHAPYLVLFYPSPFPGMRSPHSTLTVTRTQDFNDLLTSEK